MVFMFRGDVKKHLLQLSQAADSICDGDLVDRCIRRNQQWSLLPLQVSLYFPQITLSTYSYCLIQLAVLIKELVSFSTNYAVYVRVT